MNSPETTVLWSDEPTTIDLFASEFSTEIEHLHDKRRDGTVAQGEEVKLDLDRNMPFEWTKPDTYVQHTGFFYLRYSRLF